MCKWNIFFNISLYISLNFIYNYRNNRVIPVGWSTNKVKITK